MSKKRRNLRPNLSVCVDQNIYEKLKEICAKQDTTISQVMRRLCKQYIEDNRRSAA